MVLSAASMLNQLLCKQNRNPHAEVTTAKAVVNSILTHLKNHRLQKAVSILFAFPESLPYYLYAHLFQICASYCAIIEARKVESHLITFSPTPPIFLLNRAIETYGKCGHLNDARELFEEMPQRDGGSWNAMITAYSQQGYPGYALSGKTWEARKLFDEMPERNVISWNAMLAGYTHCLQWFEALSFIYLMLDTNTAVDHVTLSLILNVSAALSDDQMGKQVHGYMYRHGFHCSLVVGNALLNMYGKCGNLKSARFWFNQMSNWRDMVSWNALLTGHARHHFSEQAITIFSEMPWETEPTVYTFGILLAACANTFALYHGKQIHGFIIRHGYEIDLVIESVLIDMYSKCRCLRYAFEVLRGTSSRDVILWNTIILGFCHNHRAKEALELFKMMLEEGIKPDHVTFQGILQACIEEGLVNFGSHCFKLMSDEYCVLPQLEHYDCMIELYSRHGYMDKLENFVKTMPIEPTIPMLKKALHACKKHGYLRFQEWIMKQIYEFRY